MVYAFVTSWVNYCNSILHRVSAANVQPLQNVFNAAARIILHKRKLDHITTDIRDRLHWLPFSRELIQSVCPGEQVSASSCTNIPHWTVLTGVCISQLWSPPFRCTWWPCSATLQNNETRTDVLLRLVQSCGTHSHCQFMTHHWHRLSSVCLWRLCCSVEHMGH